PGSYRVAGRRLAGRRDVRGHAHGFMVTRSLSTCKRIQCTCNHCVYMHMVAVMQSTERRSPSPIAATHASPSPVAAAGTPAGSLRWSPRLWGILFVLGGALCLDALDVSMVGVALPSIRGALGLSTSSLQWIVSGYVLGYGGLLLLGGRAADLLGRRRVFLAALAAFAVLSLLGGLTSSAGLLIAARFVKGIAAAFTAPAGMSLLTTTFPEGPMRNRAFSVYSAFGGSGFSLGLVLSGLLTAVSWRWTLLVPAPVTLSMLLLVYTVVSAQQAGWASARTIGSFALVAAGLAAFAVIESRSRDPLMPLQILRSGALRRANIGAVTLFGSYVSFQFLATQYLQSLAGWSPIA